ncbi:MAG: hypothetical protein KJ049_09090 [Gammaproteobacteria bacterium]|nr:hypothetical protein [Gammaproteobacteria bacterium]
MDTIPKLTGKRCCCRGCGEYFSTVANFDKHRRNGACVDPATVGLLVDHRGIWKGAPTRDAEGLVRRYPVTADRTVQA